MNPREEELEQALADLYDFCISGRRYKSTNPYTIPEINNARIALRDDLDRHIEMMPVDRADFIFTLEKRTEKWS
jgi:hypothetical protein